MNIIEKAAKESGEILLKYWGKLKKVKTKTSSADLVSNADLESQKKIFQILNENFPSALLIGEEKYDRSFVTTKSDLSFLIDPLDGTLNYVHNLPFFSVSIAKLVKGKIVEGVIYVPATNEMFYAKINEGSFLNGVQLKVTEKSALDKCLFVTGWPYSKEMRKKTYYFVETINELVQEVRVIGSAALELAYLAAGRFDGYWEIGLGPWDIAAGYLIASEAGAAVSSISVDGFDLDLGEILATSPAIYTDTLKILRRLSSP